jgi:hypothetical protein
MGVDHVSGYPNAEYWHEDTIKSFHGTQAVASGSTMARVIAQETVSCVQGHSHRAELVYRTFRDGRNERTIFGMNPGALIDFGAAPKDTYATSEKGKIVPSKVNWQQGIGVIYHTPEMASPHLIPITKDGIHLFNRTYRT